MPNSVNDTVTTEENSYSLRNLEITDFFYISLLKSAGGFSTHAGVPGYFLPLNTFVLEQVGSLDSC